MMIHMMVEPIPFHRPIRWAKLRADEAEKLIRERAQKTENIIIGSHAWDRIEERSILQPDVYRILREGWVEGNLKKAKEGEWEVIVKKRMLGTREAGVVTIIFKDDQKLFVKTVEWMDYIR